MMISSTMISFGCLIVRFGALGSELSSQNFRFRTVVSEFSFQTLSFQTWGGGTLWAAPGKPSRRRGYLSRQGQNGIYSRPVGGGAVETYSRTGSKGCRLRSGGQTVPPRVRVEKRQTNGRAQGGTSSRCSEGSFKELKDPERTDRTFVIWRNLS